jgi:hypothetical protein
MSYMQKKNKQTKQGACNQWRHENHKSRFSIHASQPPQFTATTSKRRHLPRLPFSSSTAPTHTTSLLSTIRPTSRLLSIAQVSAAAVRERERDGTAAQAGVQLCGAGLCRASRSRRGLRQLRHRRRGVPAKAPCVQQPLLLQLRRPHLQLPCP